MNRCIVLLLVAIAALTALSAPAHGADETRNVLVDPQHSNAVPDSPLQPPLRLRWQANRGTPVGAVLVKDGFVHYVRDPGTRLQLATLDAASGRELWSQELPDHSGHRTGIAADGGRLFVLEDSNPGMQSGVRARALDPATGATIWEQRISAEYGFGSEPTADAGQLFFIGSGSGSKLHALRQSDGTALWEPVGISSGDESAPSLDADSVYVSVAGPQTMSFDRNTGASRWYYAPCCNGAGGTTTRLHAGRLYAEDQLVHDAATGTVVGSWASAPAFAGDGGVEQPFDGDDLRAFGPDYDTTRWRAPTLGGSTNQPLIAGDHVYSSRVDYGMEVLRLSDGAPVWCQRFTLPPGSDSGVYHSGPRVLPVAAGQGMVFVRIGYGLAAFESGGPPSSCAPPPEEGGSGSRPGTGTSTPPAPPALSLEVGRTSLLLGARTNVTATLTGGAERGGRRVVLDLDEWPFDGRFKPGASALTLQDGTVAFKLAPRRNVAVRARLADDANVTSASQEVFADFPVTVRKRGAGSARPRLVVKLFAFPKAKIRRKTVFAYLARGDRQAWRLVDRRRWERLGKRSASVALRYPSGRLVRRDRWLFCVREPRPDAFGRPTLIERRCGAKRLARSTT